MLLRSFALPAVLFGALLAPLAARAACPPGLAENLLPAAPCVSRPVRGLYESISGEDLELPALRTVSERRPPDDPRYPHEWITALQLVDSGAAPYSAGELRAQRKIVRSFSANRREMQFVSAFLALPSGRSRFVKVPGVVPLVPGRGVPLHAYITLSQMRRAGVAYGTLTFASAYITSYRTRRELAERPEIRAWLERHPHLPPPGELLARELPHTHTFAYLSTVLTQSGHRIEELEVSPGPLPIGAGFELLPPPFQLRMSLAPFAR